MTRRLTRFASALASALLFASSAAFAQTTVGPVGAYQRQPNVIQRGHNRADVAIDALNSPRFIVEAVSFKAVDESGRDLPYTSDEVFAEFQAGGNWLMTRNFHQVDTGDTEHFDADQSCISPTVDPDGQQNGRWACDRAGRPGPIEFYIALLDDDNELNYPFRICPGGGGDLSACSPRWGQNDVLFEHTFTYEVSDVLQRLDPSCRCLVQTAREAVDDLTEYEVTFRITRVDQPSNAGLSTFEDDPTIYRSGTLQARLNQAFEFDAGTVGAAGDFTFVRVGGVFRLTPAGGAKIWPGGATARGYAACYAERMSANYVTSAVDVPAIGSHACYVTSDGRVGEFRIDNLQDSPLGQGAILTVTYYTWQ
jgi:hypothetical protein